MLVEFCVLVPFDPSDCRLGCGVCTLIHSACTLGCGPYTLDHSVHTPGSDLCTLDHVFCTLGSGLCTHSRVLFAYFAYGVTESHVYSVMMFVHIIVVMLMGGILCRCDTCTSVIWGSPVAESLGWYQLTWQCGFILVASIL